MLSRFAMFTQSLTMFTSSPTAFSHLICQSFAEEKRDEKGGADAAHCVLGYECCVSCYKSFVVVLRGFLLLLLLI
jgi:hypothetical protein